MVSRGGNANGKVAERLGVEPSHLMRYGARSKAEKEKISEPGIVVIIHYFGHLDVPIRQSISERNGFRHSVDFGMSVGEATGRR